VITPGVFRIPLSIAQGERRAHFRGPFDRSDQAVALAVEGAAESVLGGRTILGRLLNLSPAGVRVALDEVGSLSGLGADLRTGDRFASVCISGLPLTPPIHGQATLVHVERAAAEPFAGFLLEGLSETAQKNIERLLIPRLPATFGEAFPARKRKTDFADQPGTPTWTQVKARAPELVAHTLDGGVAPAKSSQLPAGSAVMKLRKSSKKILFLSAHTATPALAEAFRQDGFRQVFEARSYQDARALAEQTRFDLLILDLRVGSAWAQDLMSTFEAQNLMLGTPIILVVDYRNNGALAIAADLAAIHIHDRSQGCEALLPVVCQAILGE
jgi:hypothetical protein